MRLHVHDGAHAARVTPLRYHRQLADLKLQDVQHLARSNVHLLYVWQRNKEDVMW